MVLSKATNSKWSTRRGVMLWCVTDHYPIKYFSLSGKVIAKVSDCSSHIFNSCNSLKQGWHYTLDCTPVAHMLKFNNAKSSSFRISLIVIIKSMNKQSSEMFSSKYSILWHENSAHTNTKCTIISMETEQMMPKKSKNKTKYFVVANVVIFDAMYRLRYIFCVKYLTFVSIRLRSPSFGQLTKCFAQNATICGFVSQDKQSKYVYFILFSIRPYLQKKTCETRGKNRFKSMKSEWNSRFVCVHIPALPRHRLYLCGERDVIWLGFSINLTTYTFFRQSDRSISAYLTGKFVELKVEFD